MKRYMVVTLADDGETFANFFDTYEKARNNKMNAECGMGWYAEIYERITNEETGEREYVLVEA